MKLLNEFAKEQSKQGLAQDIDFDPVDVNDLQDSIWLDASLCELTDEQLRADKERKDREWAELNRAIREVMQELLVGRKINESKY